MILLICVLLSKILPDCDLFSTFSEESSLHHEGYSTSGTKPLHGKSTQNHNISTQVDGTLFCLLRTSHSSPLERVVQTIGHRAPRFRLLLYHLFGQIGSQYKHALVVYTYFFFPVSTKILILAIYVSNLMSNRNQKSLQTFYEQN